MKTTSETVIKEQITEHVEAVHFEDADRKIPSVSACRSKNKDGSREPLIIIVDADPAIGLQPSDARRLAAALLAAADSDANMGTAVARYAAVKDAIFGRTF